jgi:hypothetical protein
MKRKTLVLLSCLVAVMLIGWQFVPQDTFFNKVMDLSIQLLQPSERFDAANMAQKLDYSEDKHWASLPQRNDESDFLPDGVTINRNEGDAAVDVFYIHGTGYTNGQRWTSPIKMDSATAENTRFSLANEASIFNGCCNIFAPRYREASIFTYIAINKLERERIMASVYPDIVRAFAYYLEYLNNDRPFIIVSHSQGTHHAMRLIKEVIDKSRLANKMIAAYLIGGIIKPVTYPYINSLKQILACAKANDIGCIIHWDTYGEGGEERIFNSKDKALCTNPLTWTTGSEVAGSKDHLGAASISGAYTMKFYGSDDIDPIHFEPHVKITQGFTQAQCRDGALYVKDLSDTDYNKLGSMKDKSYHGIDFPLFHMNIRQNVQLRVASYLNKSKVNKAAKS